MSAFCNASHYNKRSQRWQTTGRPRAHKRSGWRSMVGGWW